MNKTLKMCFISLSVVALSIAACTKEENTTLRDDSVQKIANEKTLNDNLLKFVSITAGVEKNEVYLDEKSNNFIIRNTVKLNRDTILSLYQTANVYKEQYEKGGIKK